MKRLLLAAVVLVAVAAAACSDAEPDMVAESTTTTAAPPSTTAPSTTEQPTTGQPTTAPPTTTAAPADMPACAGDDWMVVAPGPFTFWAPPELVDQEAQGIDSLYGRHVGGGLDLAFDFGGFSPNLDEIERLGATIMPVSLGGLEGDFGSVDATGAGWDTDFLTQLYVEIDGEFNNALWMGIGYDDVGLTATAECVVSTTRFV